MKERQVKFCPYCGKELIRTLSLGSEVFLCSDEECRCAINDYNSKTTGLKFVQTISRMEYKNAYAGVDRMSEFTYYDKGTKFMHDGILYEVACVNKINKKFFHTLLQVENPENLPMIVAPTSDLTYSNGFEKVKEVVKEALFCEGCKHLVPDEEEQQALKYEPHLCYKYGHMLKHRKCDHEIPRLEKCIEGNGYEKKSES